MHAVSSRKESSLPTASMHDYVCIMHTSMCVCRCTCSDVRRYFRVGPGAEKWYSQGSLWAII